LDKNSNAFTVLFAVAVCVVLAVCLASTYNGLKGRMDANAEFDRQKNVLVAMGLVEKGTSMPRAELEKLFAERVQGMILEVTREDVAVEVMRGGREVIEMQRQVVAVTETEHDIAELDDLRREEVKKPEVQRAEYAPIYRGTDEQGEVVWCVPIQGYGLWSTLYGYLALEADLNTVRGITFYKHGETPGLGGEVDNVSWQHSWRGKKILDERGNVVSVTVKKGVVDDKVERERLHMVDGLSGATITSNGVTRFVENDLETYEPYFEKQRKS